jgi:hypothetical protein
MWDDSDRNYPAAIALHPPLRDQGRGSIFPCLTRISILPV